MSDRPPPEPRDAVVVADRLSKRYPRIRALRLARTTSPIFGSLFGRDSSSEYWDEDEAFDDDDDEVGAPAAEARTADGEFWALRDVSVTVPRGGGLGVLGLRDAGKTTLLRIVGGQAFPSQGRVLVRGRVSLLSSALAAALREGGETSRALVRACCLLGVPAKTARRYADRIIAFAGVAPIVNATSRQRDPTAETRLALAAAGILPSAVILLDELPRLDEGFVERLTDRLRAEREGGRALIVASRRTQLVRELCDETVWLEDGRIVESGQTSVVASRYETSLRRLKGASGETNAGVFSHQPFVEGEYVPEGREFRVPSIVPPFNNWAALLSGGVRAESEASAEQADASQELWVEVRLETGLPHIEARCGVGFMPSFGGVGTRIELGEPIRFIDPGTYLLAARAEPGALTPGLYDVRVDAIVSNPQRRRATVLVRDGGRVRVAGEASGSPRPDVSPITLWDGSTWDSVGAEWFVEQEVVNRLATAGQDFMLTSSSS